MFCTVYWIVAFQMFSWILICLTSPYWLFVKPYTFYIFCLLPYTFYSVFNSTFNNNLFLFFRHALWRRVQAVVTPFLAQLVSIIDCDCNLDLLLDIHSEESLKKLWLDIFGDFKLLNVPYTRVENKYVII